MRLRVNLKKFSYTISKLRVLRDLRGITFYSPGNAYHNLFS